MAGRTPYEGGSEEYYSGSRIKYPNPFFDIASSYVPNNIKVLFKYCRGFFYSNGFIRNIVTKLTEYPITDLLFDAPLDAATKDKYIDILNYNLKIKQLLIEIGLDYFTFGNAFLSANLKFKRYLTCNECGHSVQIEKLKDWKFKNFRFEGTCPNCYTVNRGFKVEDTPIKSIDSFKIIRWAPEQIDIDYDDTTGESTYYYTISKDKKKKILNGDRRTLIRTPYLFLEALKEGRPIELDSRNLYHLKRPTLAEENQGWGKPAILPAIKDLYYMQTLQRGNEAVAHEHIVPKKAIYPAANGPIDPFSSMNLGKWRGQIEEQILKWKSDPNHIGIFPIPIGYQQLGGDAKMLLLTPELKFLEENVITNMGLPLDFIRGGASWTGSSISLRIVENHFLPYREMLIRFVNDFIIRKLHESLGLPKIKIKFQKLKMTDDSESKQLMLNLRESREISQETLHDAFGFDHEEELGRIENERKELIMANTEEATAQAKAQGKSQEILARAQARAQQALEDETFRLKEQVFTKNILQENGNISLDSSELIKMLAYQLSITPPEQQESFFMSISQNAPITAALMMERFLNTGMMGGGMPLTESTGPGAGRPEEANTKEDQIKPKSDKQKGQTRGTV